jgi:hypothetical protein
MEDPALRESLSAVALMAGIAGALVGSFLLTLAE